MKAIIFILTLSVSASAFAFNCKKECKAESKQCQIIVKDNASQLEYIYRARPYSRRELREALKDVKRKKKEEMSYCREMLKECYEDCRS